MTITELAIPNLLDTLADELKQAIIDRQLNNPLMIGISTGGVRVAEIMHARLGFSEPLGLLDISFYRDVFSQIGVHPNV